MRKPAGFTLVELLARQPKPRAKSRGRRQARQAFTLVELLVVIAIIALLAALLLPALREARERGKRAVCVGGIRQLYLAVMMYADDNGSWLPIPNPQAGFGVNAHQVGPVSSGPPWYPSTVTSSVAAQLYPYLRNNRVWLCPSFQGKHLNSAGYGSYYDWANQPGPLSATLGSYSYLGWRTVGAALIYNVFGPPYIAGQYSVKIGQDWGFGDVKTFGRCPIFTDAVFDGTLESGGNYTVGWDPWGYAFHTSHYDRGANLGGNVIRGDGNIEWFPWNNGANWIGPVNGRFDLAPANQ